MMSTIAGETGVRVCVFTPNSWVEVFLSCWISYSIFSFEINNVKKYQVRKSNELKQYFTAAYYN